MVKNVMLLLFIVFIAGCGPEGRYEDVLYTYTVKNESGHFVTVEGYYTDCCPSSLVTVYHYFKNGSKITKKSVSKSDPIPSPYTFMAFFGKEQPVKEPVDSIKVIYDNSKVSFFYPEKIDDISNERNPLGRYYNRGNTEETFIFTPQDYENAEDCNGSCE